MSKKLDAQLRGYKNPDGMKKDPTYPIFEAGVEHGKQQTRYAVLTFLEKKYMDPNTRPPRGSDEAKQLLDLAKEVSEFIRGLDAAVTEVTLGDE